MKLSQHVLLYNTHTKLRWDMSGVSMEETARQTRGFPIMRSRFAPHVKKYSTQILY
jgi:hypothetical protein